MVASYPDTFTGVRVIVSAVRKLPDVNISATLQIATQMVENRPDVVAGFDLVGAAAEQERSCGRRAQRKHTALHTVVYYCTRMFK